MMCFVQCILWKNALYCKEKFGVLYRECFVQIVVVYCTVNGSVVYIEVQVKV